MEHEKNKSRKVILGKFINISFDLERICLYKKNCPNRTIDYKHKCINCDYSFTTIDHLPAIKSKYNHMFEEILSIVAFEKANATVLTNAQITDLDAKKEVLFGSMILLESTMKMLENKLREILTGAETKHDQILHPQ
jgi:hypothetical protein